jgi:hypothetical protein
VSTSAKKKSDTCETPALLPSVTAISGLSVRTSRRLEDSATSLSGIGWTIVALYVAVSLLRPADHIPANLNAPLSALLPMAFTVIHGSRQYGWRGMLAFAMICVVVSNAFENVSILTGLPFGHYHYSDNLGPKLFLVPLLIGSAYLGQHLPGMGYLSWTVARVILYGVRGWYLTVFVFFQLFALYQSRRPGHPQPAASEVTIKPSFWWPTLAMYAVAALRPVVTLLFLPTGAATIIDQAGVIWNVEALYGVCALGGIFAMGAFFMLALLRITERVREVTGTDRIPAQHPVFSCADHLKAKWRTSPE